MRSVSILAVLLKNKICHIPGASLKQRNSRCLILNFSYSVTWNQFKISLSQNSPNITVYFQ